MAPKKNARQLQLEEEARKEKEEIERLKRLAEERERNLKLIQEEARENALRKPIIEDTVVVFENLLQAVRHFKKEVRNVEGWKKYLKCDNIPNTNVPAEARKFLYKFHQEFLDYHDKHLNWWVQCDQNSIMTQDIRIPDTRRQTINKIRQPTGKFYDQKLRFMMKVYESLEDSLRRRKMSSTRYEDLLTVRSSFREKTFQFLDTLTFEILMSIDREMNSMTPLIAHYSYSSPDFINFIWSFKDVTLPQNLNKHRSIKIQPLQMNITMPDLPNLENTSVRVLWFKRDFYSDYCPSYSPSSSFDMKFENLDSAIDREMKMRKDLRDDRLTEMRQAREDYETKMEEIRLKKEAEEAAMKSNKNKTKEISQVKNKKKGKNKAEPIEPPIVDESTYVNVDEEYIEYEDKMFEDARDAMSPASLNLNFNELNMREYQILGGLYKIECLERPIQTKEIYQHLFVRLNEHPHVLKYRNFHHIYVEPVLKNVKEERKSLFAEKVREAKEKALSNLIKVEMKLPDKIIWWEEPIACRWEPWEESEEFQLLDPKLQDYNVNYEKYVKEEQQKLWLVPDSQYKCKIKLNDFQLASYSEETQLLDLVKYYLLPVLPIEYSYFVDKLEMIIKKQREWRFFKEQHVTVNDITKYDEEMESASVDVMALYDKFLKHFEMKYFKPRELFPQRCKPNIEVLENLDLKDAVQTTRMELQKKIGKEEEYEPELYNEIPIENEPLMLSELLDRVETIHKNMMPIFKKIKQNLNVDEQPRVARKSKKTRISKKSRITTELMRRKSSKNVKKVKKARKRSKASESESVMDETITESSTNESKLFLIPHHKGKWVTKDIYEPSLNDETKTFTFYAGRCGTFGLAIKRYFNLPFRYWEMNPIIEKSVEKHVLMKVDGQKISIEFKITASGIAFKILKPGKTPMQELRRFVKIFELKKILSSLNINLFPEVDASWYIQNTSEKHSSMEFHTYKSMAIFCMSHRFQHHELNSFGDRREIVIKSKLQQKIEDFINVYVTPLKVYSGDVKLDDSLKLDIQENPPEQEFCADLFNFLKSEVDKSEHRVNQRSFMLIWHVQTRPNKELIIY